MRQRPLSRLFTVLFTCGALAATAMATTGCNDESAPAAVTLPASAPPAERQAPTAMPGDDATGDDATGDDATTVKAPQKPATLTNVSSGSTDRAAPSFDEAATDQLGIKRFVITDGVDNREPGEPLSSVELGEVKRVYAFVEVHNPVKAPSGIEIVFEHKESGTTVGHVELDVGASPRWRTWGFTRGINKTGTWTAIVSTHDGRELARETFDVTAPPAA